MIQTTVSNLEEREVNKWYGWIVHYVNNVDTSSSIYIHAIIARQIHALCSNIDRRMNGGRYQSQ